MTEPLPDHDATPSDDQAGEKLVLNSPEEARALKDFLLWAGVIVLAVLCAYSPAMHGKFLWDDDRHVQANPDLKDATGLGDIWTGHWRMLSEGKEAAAKKVTDVFTPQYYPFTHTTYWLEAQIFGQNDPTVFHITNLLLHAAAAIALWFLLRELAVPGAWVIAAIFALHPINVESVAWISERKNVLCGALYFGSILAFLKSPMGLHREGAATGKDRDLTLYFISLALFILACLSKTVAVSAPAVILLLLWWKRGKLSWQDVAWTAPMFVVGIVLSSLTSWVEVYHVGAHGPEWDWSFVQRILIAGNAIWFYIGKLLLPIHQSFIYPKWNVDPSRPELWIAPAAVVVVLIALFALRKKLGTGPFVAFLIYVGVLVPALGFFNVFPMKYSFVADHFQYLAAPALIALIIAVLTRLIRRFPTQVSYVLAAALLLTLAVLTGLRSTVFQGPYELWTATALANPNSAMVRYNAGVARIHSLSEMPGDDPKAIQQRLADARYDFEAATRIDPNHANAWQMLGDTFLMLKRPDDALKPFERSLAVDPQNVDAAMGRGRAFIELKRPDDALAAYQQALKILEDQHPHASRSKAAETLTAIGRLLAAKGDQKGAEASFKRAIEAWPQFPISHFEYGEFLEKIGKKPEAAEQYAMASADPNFVDGLISIGMLQIEVGNLGGAQTTLADATQRLKQRGVAMDSNREYPRLREAALAFDAAVRKKIAAATQATKPSTTQAATQFTTSPTQPSTKP